MSKGSTGFTVCDLLILEVRMVKETLQRSVFIIRSLTQRKLDALDLLEMDHLRLDLLFLRWRFSFDHRRRGDLFDQIKREFLAHSHLEETIFYPTCEKIPELKRLTADAKEEHKFIKILIKEITGLSQADERSVKKMKVLHEEIAKHAKEEENIFFPRVREFMKKGQLDKMNRSLRLAKQGKGKGKAHKVAA